MPDNFLFNDLGSSELSTAALGNLQCNILKSNGRPRSTQVFHRFRKAEELAAWLLRSNMPQPTRAGSEDDVSEVVTVLFSAQALRWLAPSSMSQQLDAMDPAFLRGARHPESLKRLRANRTTWGPHQDQWHVVELYAHDAAREFQPAESENCVVEYGSGYKDGQKLSKRYQHSYGHFNLRDGISMPVYTQESYTKLEEKPAGDKWTHDPRHKLSTLLVRDPLVESNEAFGSYFAFLKYKQNKAKFDLRIGEIVDQIANRRKQAKSSNVLTVESVYEGLQGLTGAELIEGIKRHVVGRDTEGTTAFGTAGNDFDFRTDPTGTTCPFHTHMSKMNPRGRTGNPEHERSRTIARRGTSYYETKIRGKVEPGTGVLFWSAQASIANQLEYILEKWAHASNVDVAHTPTPDFDAVIGTPDRTAASFTSWQRWKSTTDMDFNIWDCVELTGGEYLYAPSIDGFRMLQEFAHALSQGAKP